MKFKILVHWITQYSEYFSNSHDNELLVDMYVSTYLYQSISISINTYRYLCIYIFRWVSDLCIFTCSQNRSPNLISCRTAGTSTSSLIATASRNQYPRTSTNTQHTKSNLEHSVLTFGQGLIIMRKPLTSTSSIELLGHKTRLTSSRRPLYIKATMVNTQPNQSTTYSVERRFVLKALRYQRLLVHFPSPSTLLLFRFLPERHRLHSCAKKHLLADP